MSGFGASICSARIARARPGRAGARRARRAADRRRRGSPGAARTGAARPARPISSAVGPRRDLRREPRAARRGRVGGGEEPAPLVRVAVVLQARERDRPAGLARQLLHPAELRILGHQVGRHLEARRGRARPARGRCRAARPRRRTCRARSSPSMARWSSVREVEKPSAPAAMPSRTIAAMRGDVVGGRGLVPRAALAHHVGAHRAVRHLRADVERRAACARARRGTRGSSPTPTGCPRRARCRGCPRRLP